MLPLSRAPKLGDWIRDARSRARIGKLESRVGSGAVACWYVFWNDGSRSIVKEADIHTYRYTITGYVLLENGLPFGFRG